MTHNQAFSGNLRVTSTRSNFCGKIWIKKIRTSCSKSAGDLWEKLREAWASLEQKMLDKLVEIMP